MKKKVGILTYHNTFNAGAFLQAYATVKLFEQEGFDVEVIDYTPLTGFIKEYKTRFYTKKPVSGLRSIWNKNRVLSSYLPLSKKSIISDRVSRALKLIDDSYDAIVIGSDTVFEVRDRKKAYAPTIPNIYYASSDIKIKKYSFAASADKSDFSLLSDDQEIYVRKAIEDMRLVSVRDEFTSRFIEMKTSISPELIYDPTFAIEIGELFPEKKLKEFGSFAVLNVADPKYAFYVAKEIRRRGWRVICPTRSKYADVNLIGKIDPFEWAGLYRHAQFAVTDRFHGTIFSLKAGCPVLSIDDAAEYKSIRSKKNDMLFRLGLNHFLVDYREVQDVNEVGLAKRFDEVIEWRGADEIRKAANVASDITLNFVKRVAKDVRD